MRGISKNRLTQWKDNQKIFKTKEKEKIDKLLLEKYPINNFVLLTNDDKILNLYDKMINHINTNKIQIIEL